MQLITGQIKYDKSPVSCLAGIREIMRRERVQSTGAHNMKNFKPEHRSSLKTDLFTVYTNIPQISLTIQGEQGHSPPSKIAIHFPLVAVTRVSFSNHENTSPREQSKERAGGKVK